MVSFEAGASAEDALIPVLDRVYRQQLTPVVQGWLPGLAHPGEINLTTLHDGVERMAVAANRLPEVIEDRAMQQRVSAFRKVNTSWMALAALTIQYEADRTAGHPRHVLTWESAARTVQRLTFEELPTFMRVFKGPTARLRQVPKETRAAAAAVVPTHDVNGERLPNPALRSGAKPKLGAQKGVRYPPRSVTPQAAPER